jgi:hypothetical protein
MLLLLSISYFVLFVPFCGYVKIHSFVYDTTLILPRISDEFST